MFEHERTTFDGTEPALVGTNRFVATIVVGWVALELIVTLGTVLAADWVAGAPTLGFALSVLVGTPAIAAPLTAYALRRGQLPSTWDWQLSKRAVFAGLVGGVVTLGVAFLVEQVDQALFGSVGEGYGELSLRALVLLWLGNGIAVPVAEEQVWRGIVQSELVDTVGPAVGIATVAVLFSLKHAVIDGSLSRLLTATAGGLILGYVRHQWGTASSTVAHVSMNLALMTHLLVTVVVW